MKIIQAIAHHIRDLRESSGMTQRELAVKLNLDEKNYGKLERGEKKRLDLGRLLAISEALGIELAHILRPLMDTSKLCSSHFGTSDSQYPALPYPYEQVIGQLFSIVRKQQFIIGELGRLSISSPPASINRPINP